MLIVFLAGCVHNVKFTPEQTAMMWNNIYNKHYEDYLSWFNEIGKDAQGKPIYELKPDTSPEQIKVIQRQKQIFKKLQPLLISYSDYVRTGDSAIPITEVTRQIKELIQELIKEE